MDIKMKRLIRLALILGIFSISTHVLAFPTVESSETTYHGFLKRTEYQVRVGPNPIELWVSPWFCSISAHTNQWLFDL